MERNSKSRPNRFDDIDWKAPEISNDILRPFSFRLEESVARDFISTVKDNGLFVRETLVKLMREFVNEYGFIEGEKNGIHRKRR